MGTVTSLFVRKMVAAAGVAPGPWLRSVSLDPDAGADPKARIADTAYYDLLERMADQIDVTELPLRTGASMRCDDYGALGLAFKAAPTLGGSYARVERYAALWTSVVEYELRPEGADAWFVLHRHGPRRLGMRLSNEATLASAVAIGREVAPDGRLVPLEVRTQHPAPASIAAHVRYFGCPVRFEADRDGILLSAADLTRANRLGDEGITRFLLGHLDRELADVAGEASLAAEVKSVVAGALSAGPPRMEDVARRLGLSGRSLHRRLAEEGLSFKALAEDARRELATGLLADARYSLAEIAFLTGFSEQSAFTRAFKRWSGDTPATHRRARLGGG